MRLLTVGAATLAAVGSSMGVAIASVSTPATAAPLTVGSTTFSVGTPSLTTITNGTTAAPWNTSQGDPATTAYPNSDLFPTYTPGGPTTGSGSSAEPNLAVYPSANAGTDGVSPYPSGTVGTPGPLDGYCGTGNQTTESAGTPARQRAGTTLPFAPAYFPHVVKNSDGSLTGYFDYRPKDADEALVAATSTDNGKDWSYNGEALEENPGYCPSADINDDGEGHANVITIGGNTYLYTLPRAAGDMQGVGMVVHQFSPTESSPLAGLPATEKVGIDPDAFVPTGTTTVSVTHGTAGTIPLTSLGTAGSPEQLVVGSFVDTTQTPNAPTVITCTGLGTSSLTGCTTASGSSVSVHAGDLIEQVMGFTTPSSDVGLVVPAGPNTTNGDGGLSSFTIDSTSGNTGFADPLTGTTFNNNAPNRLYVNGTAIYCANANANPTTHIEDCTTGPTASPLTLSSLEPITGDPIIPATAYNPGGGDGMTSGLVAPDGIVGVLPSYPNNGTVPSGATYVMYTEKELNYYVAGETGATGTFNSTTGQTISFTPGTYISSDMPSSEPAGGYTVQMGATAPSPSTSTAIVTVTCTSLNETTGSLGGCTVSSAYNGWTYASNSLIGAPGATTLAQSTLSLTGEGKTSDISKLNKNNEDLTILRVAYTTNGVTFSTSGLTNGGVISGAGCETGSCSNGGAYDDISSPATTANPTVNGQIDLNAYAAPGTLDATEMRWVGSAGTIITNPNGTYGLFLSGAWAADGDSDAFNQIFYSESSDGEHWSVPQMVLSTDYTFAASVAQDQALGQGHDTPLGVSAYYEGRAYGPSVVQNSDGTLTMIFAGYRLPKTISDAGTTVGTNPNAQWTVGATDPALYRNILAVTLTPSTTAASSLTSQTTVTSSNASPVVGQPVTFTATISNPTTGAGDPTGSVTFTDPAGTLCPAVAVTQDIPDTASCVTTYTGGAESDTVTATYSGDSTFATSNGSATVSVTTVPSAPTAVTATPGNRSASVTWTAPSTGGLAISSYTVTATGDGTGETCASSTTSCTVDGLTNGTAYTFSVTATNTDGTGAPSALSSAVTPSTAPDAPTDVLATPGDQSAAVTWTAGGDEGSAITGYTVTATGDGTGETCTTPDGTTTSCTVTGLTNGTAYTFSVTATNADGTGAPSVASNSVTPSTVPDAPTNVVAAAGDQSGIVSWGVPHSDGAVITGYTVTSSGGQTCTTATTSCTVTGLTNGTAYTFTVAATNADGTGASSVASNSVTPSTVPDAPTNVTATPGDESAAVTWTAPFDEGSAIIGYTVTATGDGTGETCTSSFTSCTVTGLTSGIAYTFTVTATNAEGTSVDSLPSASVTPNSAPGAPTDVVATAGNGTATVTWTAPSNGGLPITGYTVLATTGRTCTTSATTCTLTGLTNGAAISFTVSAANADGTGPASAPSNSVVPSSNTATITSAASATLAGGKKLSFTITTAGTPKPVVSVSGAPSWLTLTRGTKSAAGTGKLAGTAPAAGGVFAFEVQANNGVGPDTVQTFTVNVLAITSADTATFTRGSAGSFTVTTDGGLSGVTLSATLSTKLAGLTFHDNGNGTATLSGTPGSKDKTATVDVTATAGTVSTTQKLSVTIG
ncbi:MAG: fibronectin type III domain-containing protein [Acidimicrobiales bacterium]|jgi:hypothetical protein